MEIQKNKIVDNKTKKYLIPIIKDYGDEFVKKINSMFKLGIGIGDKAMPEKFNFNNHIFILVDTSRDTDIFVDALNWLRKNNMIAYDYPFDDIKEGCQHMIVIPVIDIHKNTFDNFANSKFSKMYSEDRIRNYFSADDPRIKVLTKRQEGLQEMVDNINQTYDVELTLQEWEKDGGEADYPISKKEEIFNSNL